MEEIYYELQKREIEAIKLHEIEIDCRRVCDYVSDYLSGVPVRDGADFLGVATNPKDIVVRYKLLSDKIMAIEKATKGFCNISDYKTGFDDLRYPNLTHLYRLYNEAKEEYALHLQANSYSTELSNVGEVDNAHTPLPLPDELRSPEAKKYLDKAVSLGYLTTEYQWVKRGHTRYQQTHLAFLFHEKLKYKYKWRPFEQLWDFKRFAQTYKAIQDTATIDNVDELESIFD